MTRRRARAPPHLDDRDLAAEVLYLHSLWRRGPPAPAHAPVPAPAAALVPSCSARHRATKRKLRRLELGAAGHEDAGSDSPHESSPSAASSSPTEPKPPSPGSSAQQEDISAGDEGFADRDAVPYRSARRNRRKRRRLKRDAAEHKEAGSEWPLAPSPPAAPKAWSDATPSSPVKPPPVPPSPGSLAQREALRAAEEFFSKRGSEDGDEEEEDEGSESEGEEEAAAGFFTGLFERDAALRGRYERGSEEGQFACMACAGRKARKGKARRFRGCVSLVQHARSAMRSGRPGAHRALAAVVCRVLGWDVERLPSIVIDPHGTLGQALTAEAPFDAQEENDNVENSASSSEENKEKDVKTGTEDSSTDDDEDTNELEEDVEEIAPLNCKDGSKNKVLGHETMQEEDAVKTSMEESSSINGEKKAFELDCGKESEKVNANMDSSLSQDKNEGIHQKVIAIGSAEKDNPKGTYQLSSEDTCKNVEHCKEAAVQEDVNATAKEPEHAKTEDDIGDTAVTRLGNNPSTEENVDENKEHTD